MHKQVKTSISVIFLFLFLFPIVEKGIHMHQHIQCHSYKSAKHVYTQDFHCLICDYTSAVSNTPVPADFAVIITISHFSFLPFIENNFYIGAIRHLSPRAPPTA